MGDKLSLHWEGGLGWEGLLGSVDRLCWERQLDRVGGLEGLLGSVGRLRGLEGLLGVKGCLRGNSRGWVLGGVGRLGLAGGLLRKEGRCCGYLTNLAYLSHLRE